jgi:O-antigen ligase
MGISFWYFTDLAAIDHPRVYFTYNHVLLYASDGLVLLALAAWGLSRWIDAGARQTPRTEPRVVAWLTRLLLALCALSTLSAVWSVDWRVSLYFSAHLWLLFGLYLSLKENPLSARAAVWGASAALLLQAGIGFVQFARQSTAFLAPLGLQWPGALTPEVRGVSVVQLADGARWLRVYGTLPHPNILGGLALVLLVGPAAWFLTGRRWRWAAGLGVAAGMALLALTFSRSAWLGCLAAAGVLVFHLRTFLRWRLATLAAVMALGPLAVLPSISPLVVTRFSGQEVPTEQQSVLDRAWMIQQSLSMIRDRPLLGVGAGGFEISLARRDPGSFNIEPIHDLPLLVTSELGLPGVLIAAGLAGVLAIGAFRSSRPPAILLSAALAGLGVVSLFDHYLWSLAPGRTLLWALMGLWAGWYVERRPTPHPSPVQGGEKKNYSPFPLGHPGRARRGGGPGGWGL